MNPNETPIISPVQRHASGLSAPLMEVVKELGYKEFTPIQTQSIPLLLEGNDLIGQSKTGSGKTAAFVLPILEGLRTQSRRLQAIILCPTRELCSQVTREARKLGRNHPGLQVIPLAGGTPLGPQIASLQNGVHIAVGTPGRILDHLKRKTLQLEHVRTVVLDEADRMLDMGFQDDMEAILEATPPSRQTVFFSATFPQSIEEMSARYQRQPRRVQIEAPKSQSAQIRQVLYTIDMEKKSDLLLTLIQQIEPEGTIIFCNMKAGAKELTAKLLAAGASAGELHGDLEQIDRDRVMAKLRNRSIRILVATDVAARGIDVDQLDLVINFDIPKPDVYVHRIGRTGRAGRSGLAITLGTPRDDYKIRMIEEYTKQSLEREASPSIKATPPRSMQHAAEMVTLYIGAGRKDKLRPADILGALTGEAGGLQGSEVGKIEIHDRFAYVAVARKQARNVLDKLQQGRIKGRKIQVEQVR